MGNFHPIVEGILVEVKKLRSALGTFFSVTCSKDMTLVREMGFLLNREARFSVAQSGLHSLRRLAVQDDPRTLEEKLMSVDSSHAELAKQCDYAFPLTSSALEIGRIVTAYRQTLSQTAPRSDICCSASRGKQANGV
jgi:hypothetical protein